MSEGFQFLDIILLAMVAGFVLLRLRSVLGRRTGHEQRPRVPVPRRESPAEAGEKVIALPDRGRDEEPEIGMSRPSGPAAAGLTRIQVVDRNFDPDEFALGARGAYEMIVTAFGSGDTDALKPLLAADVFADFSKAIADRDAAGEKQETTLVGIKSADIVEADLKGRTAEVTVKFVTELINATRDAAGQVIGGNPNAVEEVIDIWTFARDTSSRDPNWQLIATSAPA